MSSTAISALQSVQSTGAALSSSTGSSDLASEVLSGLNNIWIAGWHVPLSLIVVLIVLVGILLVCAVVGSFCQGCLFCVDKTETVVDETVQDVKGFVHKRDLQDRKHKLALIKARNRSEDQV